MHPRSAGLRRSFVHDIFSGALPQRGALMTRARWIEVGRIIGVGVIVLLYRFGIMPLAVLLGTVAIGLYPLVKTGLLDLMHEHKIGTEVFVTIAAVIAMLGREYRAGAVLMTIILIAEFIAELNADRARASIKALIGSVPERALVRRDGGEVTLPLDQVRPGDSDATACTSSALPLTAIAVGVAGIIVLGIFGETALAAFRGTRLLPG